MTTDRELLEKAAKAAGIEVVRLRLNDPIHRDLLIKATARNPHHDMGPWNPLTDDGDALRLAVKLEMQIDIISCQTRCLAFGGPTIYENESDTYAATRRAIVRAAAAIGETHGR